MKWQSSLISMCFCRFTSYSISLSLWSNSSHSTASLYLGKYRSILYPSTQYWSITSSPLKVFCMYDSVSVSFLTYLCRYILDPIFSSISMAFGLLLLTMISIASSRVRNTSWSFWPLSRVSPGLRISDLDFVAISLKLCRIYTIPRNRPRSARLKWGTPFASLKISIAPAGTALKSVIDIFLALLWLNQQQFCGHHFLSVTNDSQKLTYLRKRRFSLFLLNHCSHFLSNHSIYVKRISWTRFQKCFNTFEWHFFHLASYIINFLVSLRSYTHVGLAR